MIPSLTVEVNTMMIHGMKSVTKNGRIHVETKIKCTFDYHVDYEEVFVESTKV